MAGLNPIEAAHPIAFLAPAPVVGSTMLQFWVSGGHVSLAGGASAVLRARIADSHRYRLRWGWDGMRLFAHMWEEGDASSLHGHVFWVGDSLVCCAQVNPALLYDEDLPEVYPVVQLV
jgi:hypothetical protein